MHVTNTTYLNGATTVDFFTTPLEGQQESWTQGNMSQRFQKRRNELSKDTTLFLFFFFFTRDYLCFCQHEKEQYDNEFLSGEASS